MAESKVKLKDLNTTNQPEAGKFLDGAGVWKAVGGTTVTVKDNTGFVNAQPNNYIVVAYTGGPTTINLPDAETCDGAYIKIKKLTGEDTLVTTILPYESQLIDGHTSVTIVFSKTMCTLTAVNGDRYIGD